MSTSMSTFEALPRSLQTTVDDFQRYVVGQYMRRATEWDQAQPLIQRIADSCLGVATPVWPRVEPETIALLLQINVIFDSELRSGVCGRLVPERGGGFQAIVAGTPSQPRTRFTIGHECGHAFFFRPSPGQAQRIIPASVPAKKMSREEWLCNEFARALLVPNRWKRDVLGRDVQMSEICSLARSLSVSTEVLVRRVLYDWSEWASSVFYSVWFDSDNCNVRIFRGTKSQSRPDSTPTREAVKSVCEKGRRPLRSWLQSSYSVKDDDIVESDSTTWWRISKQHPVGRQTTEV